MIAVLVVIGAVLNATGAGGDDGIREVRGSKFQCNDNGNIARELWPGTIVLRGPDAEALCRCCHPCER